VAKRIKILEKKAVNRLPGLEQKCRQGAMGTTASHQLGGEIEGLKKRRHRKQQGIGWERRENSPSPTPTLRKNGGGRRGCLSKETPLG